MNFWQLSTGVAPSGTAEASHAGSFGVIPEGTQAPAQIKEMVLMEPTNSYHYKFYEVIFKLSSGEFKGREVRMKIKCFDDKTSIADRGKNLLKRFYDLCNHLPSHDGAPTTQDLYPMIGKVLGIKISEFVVNKPDGSISNGNYVSEIHKADKDFETLTGVKLDVPVSAIDTAFSRNEKRALPNDSSDIPF